MRQDRGVGRCRHPHHIQDTQAADADLDVRVLQHVAQFVEVLLDGLHQEAAAQKQTQDISLLRIFQLHNIVLHPYQSVRCVVECVCGCACVCVHACVRACVHVCVVSVLVKRPVLPPCAVDGHSRNPLYYLTQPKNRTLQELAASSHICYEDKTKIRTWQRKKLGGWPDESSLIIMDISLVQDPSPNLRHNAQ